MNAETTKPTVLRYVIGNDWPKCTILSTRSDAQGRTVYRVRFWYQGRTEELDCFASSIYPNPDRSRR